MIFEWDEKKNQANRKKNGIWFEEAKSVFEDSVAIVFKDDAHSEEEERFLIIGNNAFGSNLLVVHCFRKNAETIRIISARKTTKREKMFYEKRI